MKVEIVGRPTYTVELTEYEAQVLDQIMRSVGGEPDGPRGVADQLADQLRTVGLKQPRVKDYYVDGSVMLWKGKRRAPLE